MNPTTSRTSPYTPSPNPFLSSFSYNMDFHNQVIGALAPIMERISSGQGQRTPPVRYTSDGEWDEVDERGDDSYSRSLEETNTVELLRARRLNRLGTNFFKELIDDLNKFKNDEEKLKFRTQIIETHPVIFIDLPRFAVKRVISFLIPLTKKNIPFFMHNQLDVLESLRQKQVEIGVLITPEQETVIWNQCCSIADILQRQRNCIAALEGAFKLFIEEPPK